MSTAPPFSGNKCKPHVHLAYSHNILASVTFPVHEIIVHRLIYDSRNVGSIYSPYASIKVR